VKVVCRPIRLDPVLNRYEACNGTVLLPFSERILLAERIIYVVVASLLAWFVFEVCVTFIVSPPLLLAGVTVCTAVCLFVCKHVN